MLLELPLASLSSCSVRFVLALMGFVVDSPNAVVRVGDGEIVDGGGGAESSRVVSGASAIGRGCSVADSGI